ncbi:MAG TPA: hypothetical protein VF546_06910 [Pyrinomonadaceae bacterium]|jgi:hypothetical protein
MPQIPQHFLDCSIYLYESKDSAEDGEHFGGSGCLVSVQSDPIYDPASFKAGRYHKIALVCPPHIYAVTNKHVIEQGYTVIRLNTVDGNIDVLELEGDDWIKHPNGDDLAVAPIDLPPHKHAHYAIPSVLFLRRDSVYSDIGAGDDTFMIGRFVSHAGKQRNTPSLRFGSIAMLPFEKIKLEDGYMQEAFLVETRSISGYSGSPVFVYKPAKEITYVPDPSPYIPVSGGTSREAITDLVGYPMLLGIDCGHVPSYKKVLDAGGSPLQHGLKVESNTGMATVIPAWRLAELLNTEELVMQRNQKDKEYEERQKAEKQSSSAIFDIEKPEIFTADTYQDALRRASRKLSSQPESDSDET